MDFHNQINQNFNFNELNYLFNVAKEDLPDTETCLMFGVAGYQLQKSVHEIFEKIKENQATPLDSTKVMQLLSPLNNIYLNLPLFLSMIPAILNPAADEEAQGLSSTLQETSNFLKGQPVNESFLGDWVEESEGSLPSITACFTLAMAAYKFQSTAYKAYQNFQKEPEESKSKSLCPQMISRFTNLAIQVSTMAATVLPETLGLDREQAESIRDLKSLHKNSSKVKSVMEEMLLLDPSEGSSEIQYSGYYLSEVIARWMK